MTRSCQHHINYVEERVNCSRLGNVDLSACGGCPLFLLKRPPNILRQAGTFAIATVKHLANGLKYVDSEEIERRRQICTTCDLFDQANETCRSCGCSLPVKITWDSERCPLGKW